MSRMILLLIGVLIGLTGQARTIVLTTENTVTLRGAVSAQSVAETETALADLVNKRGTKGGIIYLILDTPGGSISDGEDLIQFAKTIKNLETITLFAASMGSAIVEGLPGRRLITENGTLMFHRAKGGFEGQFETGEVESHLAFGKAIVQGLEKRNASRMQLPLPKYKGMVFNELWLYGQQTIDSKAADEIISIQCSKQLIEGKSVNIMNIGFGIEIKVSVSKCPLLKNFAAEGPDRSDKIEAALRNYVQTYRWGATDVELRHK